jgi:hypothetical protein
MSERLRRDMLCDCCYRKALDFWKPKLPTTNSLRNILAEIQSELKPRMISQTMLKHDTFKRDTDGYNKNSGTAEQQIQICEKQMLQKKQETNGTDETSILDINKSELKSQNILL